MGSGSKSGVTGQSFDGSDVVERPTHLPVSRAAPPAQKFNGTISARRPAPRPKGTFGRALFLLRLFN